MRRVILFIASSLDGYIARKNGGIDWLFSDGDYGYRKFYDSVDCVLVGRKTYETAVNLGERFLGKDCYVFSRSKPSSHAKNVHFERDPVGLTKRLAAERGKGIFLEGGGETITTFLNAELVDEIVLSIHPLVLGDGIPPFANVKQQINLKLLGSTRYASGLVQLRYKVLKIAKKAHDVVHISERLRH